MSLRLLITGATGQVGWQLQRAVSPLGEVTACTRDQLNLADTEAVVKLLRETKPDIVLNAAAYTAVDKAESEPQLARTVNATSPGRIARELAITGGLMLHYSTDYVFDGTNPLPYEENDPTGPINVYGQTKLEGEQAIAASGCPYLILRTSWVYDIRGKNFLRTVLRLARERDELRMVGDQHGSPTWARTIAESTAAILSQCVQQRQRSGWGASGVFHLTAAGQTTWAEFAQQILTDYNSLVSWPADTGEFGAPLQAKRVAAIPSSEYPTPARRPLNSVLSNAKLQSVFGLRLPDWRTQLRQAMEDGIR